MIGASGRSRAVSFDPFSVIPMFVGSRRLQRHSAWLLLPWLLLGLIVVLVTAIDGSLGGVRDIRWLSDIAAVFGRSVPVTPPRVPLLRDVPDVALFFLIMLGYIMLHRQWIRISDCLPNLRERQSIIPRDEPRRHWVLTPLGYRWLLGPEQAPGGLVRLEAKLRRFPRTFKIVLVVVVVGGGLLLAILLRGALDQNVLKVFVPTALSPAEQQQWLVEARANWWASSAHPVGYVLYVLIAWLGMSLIIAYNVMGFITVYVAVAVFLVTDAKAEWLNRDGWFGWLPMTDLFRSVYWTIALFCAVMSVLVALLGSQTPIAVIGLIALYALLIPVYTFIPWLVFRSVEATARELRERELSIMLAEVDARDIGRWQVFVTEFARCREARIRPMSLGRLQLSGFASVVLLPIVLTLLQVFLPLGLGR
jgi:hypothetical protein